MKQILIKEDDFMKARTAIRNSKKESKDVVFYSNNDDLNRKVLEKEPIDILLLNQKGRKDKMKQRDSGFNQVLARIAKNKGVNIGINLDEILNSKEKEKAEILARIGQNIRLCKKSKLNLKFISKSKKDIHDMKSLGLVLGMPTQMIKNL